jgi:hypothetical protein
LNFQQTAVSREEMERLRSWLEVDHGVDFPALPFLHETIEQISSDGEVTEDELDRLALAIERVLPKDVRVAAAAKRKQLRDSRRLTQRESRRQTIAAARAQKRLEREEARRRARPLYRADFPIAGATRFEERREACERISVDDDVTLEREPDNAHDANAILILGDDDSELGYVPREQAREIAPLLDAGAEADARVRRLWETPNGYVVPIVLVKIRQAGTDPAVVTPRASVRPSSGATKPAGCGANAASFLLLLLLVLMAVT